MIKRTVLASIAIPPLSIEPSQGDSQGCLASNTDLELGSRELLVEGFERA